MDLQSPQPLDWQSVAAAVANQTIGRRLVYLDTTTSTNDVAKALAGQGEPEGLVVFAETQTAGRGRAGKAPWITPPYTAVAFTVLLRPSLPPGALGRLSMLAGVAAVDAIREMAGVPVALKWPNDLMVGPRKVGGILVESSIRGQTVSAALIGVGINVAFAASSLALSDAALPPTSLLDEAGVTISREALVVALLRCLERAYALLNAGDVATLWNLYRDRLATLGQVVRLLDSGTGGTEAGVEGVAESVSQDGALILRLPGGERRAFASGEVSLRPG